MDTIVAQASANGKAAIGIVRLSGPHALKILQQISQSEHFQFESHKATVRLLIDPQTKQAIDQALVLYMQAPNSFTGEDVVEIHAHGSPYILRNIIHICQDLGARMAEPGEFSKRAFLNNKLDLAQAEAVATLIDAENNEIAQLALNQLNGQLSKTINQIRQELIELASQLECGFDFAEEEDIHFFDDQKAHQQLQILANRIRQLIDSFATAQLYRSRFKIALVGKPNVGKSSLFNFLLKEDRALIHHVPGTTRDMVSGERKVGSLTVEFFDTAGIRKANDQVEKLGIDKSQKMITKADLCLWVLDSSRSFDAEDEKIAKELDPRKTITVVNKTDQPKAWQNLPKKWDAFNPCFHLSVLKNLGLETILDVIEKYFKTNLKGPANQKVAIVNLRHQKILQKVDAKLTILFNQWQKQISQEECLAVELRELALMLGDIVGQVDHEDVLSHIFENFCIGK